MTLDRQNDRHVTYTRYLRHIIEGSVTNYSMAELADAELLLECEAWKREQPEMDGIWDAPTVGRAGAAG